MQSFINHLVAPLCNSYASAGILPGLWQYNASSEETSGKATADSRLDVNAASTEGNSRKGPRKVVCLQTKHLQENYERWARELEQSERRSESRESSEDSSTPVAASALEEVSEETDEDCSK